MGTSVAESIVRFESQGSDPTTHYRSLRTIGGSAGLRRVDAPLRVCFARAASRRSCPIRQGTTYVDSTRMGRFDGEVIEFVPPTRIAFAETLRWFGTPMTQARPEYALEGDESRTLVHHVAVGELYGWMRFIKPAAAWMANRERSSTLDSLKRSLESD